MKGGDNMRHNQEFALDTAKAVTVALAGNPALSAGKDCGETLAKVFEAVYEKALNLAKEPHDITG